MNSGRFDFKSHFPLLETTLLQFRCGQVDFAETTETEMQKKLPASYCTWSSRYVVYLVVGSFLGGCCMLGRGGLFQHYTTSLISWHELLSTEERRHLLLDVSIHRTGLL